MGVAMPFGPQRGDEGDAVHHGQPAVDHHHVPGLGQPQVQAVTTVGDQPDPVIRIQELGDQRSQDGVVLDKQQGRTVSGCHGTYSSAAISRVRSPPLVAAVRVAGCGRCYCGCAAAIAAAPQELHRRRHDRDEDHGHGDDVDVLGDDVKVSQPGAQ